MPDAMKLYTGGGRLHKFREFRNGFITFEEAINEQVGE
jgi:hypothetical protein